MTRRLSNYHYIFNETVPLYIEKEIIPAKQKINSFILRVLFFKDNLKLLIKSQRSFFILRYSFEKKSEKEEINISPNKIAIYNKKSSFDSSDIVSSLKDLNFPFFDFFYSPLKFYEEFAKKNNKIAEEAINILSKDEQQEQLTTTNSIHSYIDDSSRKGNLNEPMKSNQKFYINIKNGSYQNIHFSLTMSKKDSSIILLLFVYELFN